MGGAHRRKQRLQLHRKSDVPTDTHAAGCDHRDAIEPAIQDTQAVLARHREGHIRLGVDTFLNPASLIPNHHMVLPPQRTAQVKLIHGRQPLCSLRIELSRKSFEELLQRIGRHGEQCSEPHTWLQH